MDLVSRECRIRTPADKPTLHLDFGVPRGGRVDVEVTAMTKGGRKVTRVANVDPNKLIRPVSQPRVSAPSGDVR